MSTFFTREHITEHLSKSTNFSCSNLTPPTLSWEHYVLINLELERLSNLNSSLTVKNECLTKDNTDLASTVSEKIAELDLLKSRQTSEQALVIKSLNVEKERLCSIIASKDRELEAMRAKVNQIGDLEQRIMLLLIEKDRLGHEKTRLNETVMEKDRENDGLRNKNAAIPHLEAKVETGEKDRHNLKHMVEDRDRTISELRSKIIGYESDLRAMSELRVKVTHMDAENERLMRELETVRAKLVNYGELEAKLRRVSQEIDRLGRIIAEKNREIEDLKLKGAELERASATIGELRGKLAQMTSENDRLTHTLEHKESDLCSLRQKLTEFERNASTIAELRGKVNLLTSENERINALVSEKNREIDILKSKLQQLGDIEQKVMLLLTEKDRLSHEKERLNSLITEKTREIERLTIKACEADSLAHQVHHLGHEKTRLNEVVMDKSRENEGLRNKNAAIPQLEQERHSLKHKLEDKEREVEGLRVTVSEKDRVIEEWQHKYHVLENLYSTVKDTTEQLGMIRQRYEDAVRMSEKDEPKLKSSVDYGLGRKTVMSLERSTVGSPGELHKSSFSAVYSPRSTFDVYSPKYSSSPAASKFF